MTETAGIHFGPAWLRDTLVQPPLGVEHSNSSKGGPGSNPNNIIAPPKLAEFRYGREEMLALFSLPTTVRIFCQINLYLSLECVKIIWKLCEITAVSISDSQD